MSHSRARRYFERDLEADVIMAVIKKLQGSLDVFSVSLHLLLLPLEPLNYINNLCSCREMLRERLLEGRRWQW